MTRGYCEPRVIPHDDSATDLLQRVETRDVPQSRIKADAKISADSSQCIESCDRFQRAVIRYAEVPSDALEGVELRDTCQGVV